MKRRNWKIARRGEFYNRPAHGPVRVFAANGIYHPAPVVVEMRPQDPRQAREFDERIQRMAGTIAHRLPVTGVDSRILNLRIRT